LLTIFLRTLILYSVVVLTMRLMGKRQIGQLEPYELVIAVMIAELAAVPMEDKGIPLINGFIPILTLLFLQVLISYIALKSLRFNAFMDGVPSIIIRNGHIDEKELERNRINLVELLGQLRAKGYPNIADVEIAILETSGEISIIPKSQKRSVTPEDLNLPTEYEGLPIPLIIDGLIQEKNLALTKLDSNWLNMELKNRGISSAKNVFFASLDTQGNLFIQEKEKRKRQKR